MSPRRLIQPGRRVTTALIAAAVLAVCGGVVGGVLIVRAIQASRLHNTVATCERDNREHRAIRRFVVFAAPSLAARARHDFPVIDDCEAYARERVR
jgi:hypothetical protein